MDDIAVYNKILSTEEVGYLYDLRMVVNKSLDWMRLLMQWAQWILIKVEQDIAKTQILLFGTAVRK